jgi:hypothetical protein
LEEEKMPNLYFISLSIEFDRDAITQYFNTIPDKVNFWFYNLPSSVFVKSDLKAKEIKELIQSKFGQHYLIVIEIGKAVEWSATIPTSQVEYFKEYTTYIITDSKEST